MMLIFFIIIVNRALTLSKLRDKKYIIYNRTSCEDNEPSRFVLAQKSIWRMSIIEERYDFPWFIDCGAVV